MDDQEILKICQGIAHDQTKHLAAEDFWDVLRDCAIAAAYAAFKVALEAAGVDK